MKRFLTKRRFLFLTSAGVLLACVAGATYFYWANESQSFKVIASNFEPGTKISYEVFSKGVLVDSGNQNVDQAGKVQLTVPDSAVKDKLDLTYKIDIEKAQIDKMMDANPVSILMDVNQSNKSVSFSGSGFKEFSDILVSTGDRTVSSKTDWAGMISETASLNAESLKGKSGDIVKIAFQNFNLGSDVDLYSPDGAIEVFFGDPDGSSTEAVMVRYGRALRMMTDQLTITMVNQVLAIGALIDAKQQLETQRKFQELQARAHKDYHPSEQMCRFGTFVRSVADSDSRADMNKAVLNRYLLDQYLGQQNSSSAMGQDGSIKARLHSFTTKYCDPTDNNNGLKLLCPRMVGESGEIANRFNKDIDYTRTLDTKLTMDINFIDPSRTKDEEDVLALAQNLYFPQVFEKVDAEFIKDDPRYHYDSRAFAAKMSVAHNSFVNIIGMKSSAPAGHASKVPPPEPPPQMRNPRGTVPPISNLPEDSGWTYMKAFMRELNIIDKNLNLTTDDEINGLLGERPSYYAQMEVLMKKIYQSPEFYTNLYDKPVNVERIGVAMDAISIMHQRDRYESFLRREMLTSMLVEEALGPQIEDVNARIFSAMQMVQPSTTGIAPPPPPPPAAPPPAGP